MDLCCRSIVLVNQDSLRLFSRPFPKCLQYFFLKSWITYPVLLYLEGNNAVSIRKGWTECMPSFIAVAQLLLSQPMNFSAHPLGDPGLLGSTVLEYTLEAISNTLLKSDVTRRDHVSRCHGSHECWFTHRQFHSQFHSRRHSLRITLKYTTLVCMRSSNAWTIETVTTVLVRF